MIVDEMANSVAKAMKRVRKYRSVNLSLRVDSDYIGLGVYRGRFGVESGYIRIEEFEPSKRSLAYRAIDSLVERLRDHEIKVVELGVNQEAFREVKRRFSHLRVWCYESCNL